MDNQAVIPDRVQVFVYGTLKPGEANYGYCANDVIATQAAIAYGQLFDLPLGYPAMAEGSGLVYGIVLTFADAAILTALDQLEDYDPDRPAAQNEYYRQAVAVFNLQRQPLGTAWTYLMLPEQIQQANGIWLPNGIWTGGRSPNQPLESS